MSLGDQMFNHVSVPLDHPVDYFSYLTQVRPVPQRWPNMAISQLDMLRRASGLRPRQVVVPDETDNTIEAYGSKVLEVAVEPGSWLWLVSWAAAPEGEPIDNTAFSFNITDVCSGIPLCKYYAAGALAGAQSGPDDYVYLSMPKPVTGQGLLSVEIFSYTSRDVENFQLLLFFACPMPNVARQLAG
jgi:hypothetical protein